MFSGSTIINARTGNLKKSRVILGEADYAHKFKVPHNMIATVTATQYGTVDAIFCLYRQHEEICDDCQNSAIKYTQVFINGEPRCIGCDDCGGLLNTEMDVESAGWYVLFPHNKDGERIEIETCPMTFITHLRNRS